MRAATGLPMLTDVHEPDQCAPAAEVVDVLQIPAFLCRQTDLLVAAGATGQAGEREEGPVDAPRRRWRARSRRCAQRRQRRDVAVTERGTFFGYGDLVVDMRNFARLREATRRAGDLRRHALACSSRGRATGGASGGRGSSFRRFSPPPPCAGADGFFLETHPDPASAPSDAATQWPLDQLGALLERTLDLWSRAREQTAIR